MSDWCILRCSSAHTMRLAHSLTDAGISAWSPVEVKSKRVPRANIKRQVVIPLMPSYVFADARKLFDLIELAEAEHKAQPDFRLFRSAERIPLIADCNLDALRLTEKKRTVEARKAFTKGETVKLTDGGFTGLTGTVESAQGQFVMVAIPGFNYQLKVAAWCLLREGEETAMQVAA